MSNVERCGVLSSPNRQELGMQSLCTCAICLINLDTTKQHMVKKHQHYNSATPPEIQTLEGVKK